ncbi:MAG: c-type cytochrome [Gammaproteobacteria bacterium]|nr:MAG: c-type cytochrome [Gammaproteobacteria bacterium]
MKHLVGVVSILLLSLSSVVVYAGDAEAGKAKAVTCAACHGGEGISPTDIWPNLAGQKEQYLLAQIKAFKDGTRVNAQMAPMVANLSDDDMANLAAYYSSLGCKE